MGGGKRKNPPPPPAIVRRKRFYADTPQKADFTRTSVSDSLFPVKRFKDIFEQVLERDKGEAFSYQPSEGYMPLRSSIAALLTEKAIKTGADRVQIISGSQQGIDLVSRVLINAGDTVFFDKYTYMGAVNAVLARGANFVCVDFNDKTALEDAVRRLHPKLFYVMPTFRTPTGECMPPETKRNLLNIAYSRGIYIIEEDNSGDFNYSEKRLAPLKALDYKNRVIYIKGFSKILMPGLRLGYMVLPKTVSESVARLKDSVDISTSGFIQRAFDLFLQGSGRRRHIEEIRTFFGKRYDFIHNAAKTKLGTHFDIPDPRGGLILWLKIKKTGTTDEEICRRLSEKGVFVIPGSFYCPDDETTPYIALSFADISEKEIEDGVDIIAETLNNGICNKKF